MITRHNPMTFDTIQAFSSGRKGVLSYHLLIDRAAQFYQLGGTHV